MGCGASTPGEVLKLNEVVLTDKNYKGETPPLKAAEVKSLERLCLAGCKTIKEEEGGGAVALALNHFKNLTELDLSRCPLGALGIMSLEGTLSLGIPANLQTLVLSSTVDNAAGTAFSRLAAALSAGEFKQLHSLDFGYNTIKPNGAMALGKSLKEFKPPLREIILPDCHIGGSGATALAQALMTLDPALRIKLDLFSNQIGEAGGEAIGELLAAEDAPRITHLSLQASAFGSTGLAKFALGLKGPDVASTLEALDLSGNGIGNHDKEGCAALTEAFISCPPKALKVLNLAENTLHYGEANALLASLKHAESLTWLDVSHNELRDESIEPLLEAFGGMGKLETFGINENPRIGDDCMAKLLGGLAGIGSLRGIHACNTGMAVASKAAAASILSKGKPFEHLDVRGNGPLGAHKDALRAAAKDGAELLLPGDDGPATELGLDTRKMWFQWVGEGVFIPKGGFSQKSSTDW